MDLPNLQLQVRIVAEVRQEILHGVVHSGPRLILLDAGTQDPALWLFRVRLDQTVGDIPAIVPVVGLVDIDISQFGQRPRVAGIERYRRAQVLRGVNVVVHGLVGVSARVKTACVLRPRTYQLVGLRQSPSRVTRLRQIVVAVNAHVDVVRSKPQCLGEIDDRQLGMFISRCGVSRFHEKTGAGDVVEYRQISRPLRPGFAVADVVLIRRLLCQQQHQQRVVPGMRLRSARKSRHGMQRTTPFRLLRHHERAVDRVISGRRCQTASGSLVDIRAARPHLARIDHGHIGRRDLRIQFDGPPQIGIGLGQQPDHGVHVALRCIAHVCTSARLGRHGHIGKATGCVSESAGRRVTFPRIQGRADIERPVVEILIKSPVENPGRTRLCLLVVQCLRKAPIELGGVTALDQRLRFGKGDDRLQAIMAVGCYCIMRPVAAGWIGISQATLQWILDCLGLPRRGEKRLHLVAREQVALGSGQMDRHSMLRQLGIELADLRHP